MCRCLLFVLLIAGAAGDAAEYAVGPGRGMTRVEDALALATAGDTIVVHPRPDGPYRKVALRIDRPDIAIRGVRGADGARPVFDGEGVDFAGGADGDRAQAIVQIGREGSGASITGIRLVNARNRAGDAAGVRSQGADRLRIVDCEITACDVGVRSDGGFADGREQLIDGCLIHANGGPRGGGNVILAGHDARVLGCELRLPAGGANLRARTHGLWVEASYVHDGGGRELDLVDAAGVTDQPTGHAVVLGSLIVSSAGTEPVIRFGSDDGRDRSGTLWLVHATVVARGTGPAVRLDAPSARAAIANALVLGDGARPLVARADGTIPDLAWSGGSWASAGWRVAARDARGVQIGGEAPLFITEAPFHPAAASVAPIRDGGVDLSQVPLPVAALPPEHPLRHKPPQLLQWTADGATARPRLGEAYDTGAFEAPHRAAP